MGKNAPKVSNAEKLFPEEDFPIDDQLFRVEAMNAGISEARLQAAAFIVISAHREFLNGQANELRRMTHWKELRRLRRYLKALAEVHDRWWRAGEASRRFFSEEMGENAKAVEEALSAATHCARVIRDRYQIQSDRKGYLAEIAAIAQLKIILAAEASPLERMLEPRYVRLVTVLLRAFGSSASKRLIASLINDEYTHIRTCIEARRKERQARIP